MRNIGFVRTAAILFSVVLLAECSGGGSSQRGTSSVIPTSNGSHTLRAMSGGTGSCPEYPDGSVAIQDDTYGHIYFYPGPITSSSTSTATITLPNTSDGFGSGGMTFDPSGNLWVAYSTDSGYKAILEYAAPLTTDESPSVTISGSNTLLSDPRSISYNQSTNSVFVLDRGANAIYSFSTSASGNASPSTTISGSSTYLSTAEPSGIRTDASTIYVSLNSSGGSNSGIITFPISSNGNASYTAGIVFAVNANVHAFAYDAIGNTYYSVTGSSIVDRYILATSTLTGLTSYALHGIAVDDSGYMYGAYSGGNLYVFPPNSGTPSVTLTGILGSVNAMALYSPGILNGTEPQ